MNALTALSLDLTEIPTATQIDSEHRLAQTKAGEAVQHAINCGRMLLEVKASLNHGQWLPWLKNQQASGAISFSEITAQRYMRIASNPSHVTDLEAPSIRKALELLAGDDEPEQTDWLDESYQLTQPDLVPTVEEVERSFNLLPGDERKRLITLLVDELRREDRRNREHAVRARSTFEGPLPDSVDIRNCSMQELLTSGIRPDAIITDPPYPAEYLPLYEELARLSQEVPLVAVMVGGTYLPQVLEMMCKHLSYRWQMTYLTPGGSSRIWPRQILTGAKSVLLFGEPDNWIYDVVKSDGDDKRFDEWGQSESGFLALVDRLTLPGQLVCDPFLGGGTTAVASYRLGRRFVGCDINADDVATARTRIQQALMTGEECRL